MENILNFNEPINVALLDEVVDAFGNPSHPQVRPS
jgi:hypothetical protein